MTHRYEVTVSEADLDELGHVNNARYLDYLERGRTTWYDEAALVALCAGDTARAHFGTVVVNINIDFKAECHAGEALSVVSAPIRAGAKSFVVGQRIEKADGTLAADAQVTSVVMDLRTRRAVPLTPAALDLFSG